jgi:hypothetical protein
MLTLNGYKKSKTEVYIEDVRKTLTVKPYVPKVFVDPRYVTKYKVFKETETDVYLPKHYGIDTYGEPSESTRNVP